MWEGLIHLCPYNSCSGSVFTEADCTKGGTAMTWTVEMSQMEWALFRVVLKIMDFEYEASEVDNLVHIEVKCSEQDSVALEATHKAIATGLQERSKKPC